MFIFISISLILATLGKFTKSSIDNQLEINHFKDDEDLQVNLDIVLFRYPCGLVSLDIMDILHQHTLDVQGTLKKFRTDQNQRTIKEFSAKQT